MLMGGAHDPSAFRKDNKTRRSHEKRTCASESLKTFVFLMLTCLFWKNFGFLEYLPPQFPSNPVETGLGYSDNTCSYESPRIPLSVQLWLTLWVRVAYAKTTSTPNRRLCKFRQHSKFR